MTWKNVPKDISPYFGFVYMITNLKTNRKYIGKKFFKTPIVRPPLKGKKNQRHDWKESDWKDYFGSSKQLLEDVEKFGADNFKQEIIQCYKTKWECAYYEVFWQVEYKVLFSDNFYNGIINCRLPKAPKDLKL